MHLNADLECVASFPKSEDLSQFVRDIAPEWIEEAATGTATLRRRRLPMEQVPRLVIGMALLRDRPITEVLNKLDLAMPSPTKPTVAGSAWCKRGTGWGSRRWRGCSRGARSIGRIRARPACVGVVWPCTE